MIRMRSITLTLITCDDKNLQFIGPTKLARENKADLNMVTQYGEIILMAHSIIASADHQPTVAIKPCTINIIVQFLNYGIA